MLNDSGAVTKTYDYDAYGNELSRDLNDTNPFRYCGEYYDTETGFIYLRARYYDPTLGRFISQDSHWNVGNMIYGDNLGKYSTPDINAIMQSSNLYAYCMNNPILYRDYSGESLVLTFTLIGLGLGLLAGGCIGHHVATNKGYTSDDGWDYYKYLLGFGVGGAVVGGAIGYGVGYIAAAISAPAVVGASGTLGTTIVNSWQEAEKYIRDMYDAVKYTFTDLMEGMSPRIVDGYNTETGIIYEVKYGLVSKTDFILSELERDIYLLLTDQVKAVEWHFFMSQITDKGGDQQGPYVSI